MAFTLKGKLQQPSSVSTLLIAYPKMHIDSIPIQADGSFTYSGNFSEPGEMQITTRKSTTTIWLDSSIKNVFLSEKPNQNSKIKLTVDSVVGSEDSYLYYYASLPKQTITKTTKPVSNRSFYSQKEIEAYIDSLNKSIKPGGDSFFRVNSFREIDSVFKVRPDSKVLPWLIRNYELLLGFDLMRELYYRLNTEQQESETGRDLLNLLKRLHLLRPGNVFEDFTIKDDHAKDFKFSSLKSKYVLIIFWASYCGPCRAKHPYLHEAYLKTKEAGLEIVSISLDEDRNKWLGAIKQDKLEWINVSDLKGENSDLALKYKISGVPFSVLLDENRKVILVDPGSYQIIDFFKNRH
jgi:thiol-disulfide isomerase/thioredoxin